MRYVLVKFAGKLTGYYCVLTITLLRIAMIKLIKAFPSYNYNFADLLDKKIDKRSEFKNVST